MVPLVIEPETAPLSRDADGQIRVGGTRVTLETVVLAFRQGATPEQIVDQYPALDLVTIYSVIAYYLRHQAQVAVYLAEQEKLSLAVRAENEARFPPMGIRDRLLARRGNGK